MSWSTNTSPGSRALTPRASNTPPTSPPTAALAAPHKDGSISPTTSTFCDDPAADTENVVACAPPGVFLSPPSVTAAAAHPMGAGFPVPSPPQRGVLPTALGRRRSTLTMTHSPLATALLHSPSTRSNSQASTVFATGRQQHLAPGSNAECDAIFETVIAFAALCRSDDALRFAGGARPAAVSAASLLPPGGVLALAAECSSPWPVFPCVFHAAQHVPAPPMDAFFTPVTDHWDSYNSSPVQTGTAAATTAAAMLRRASRRRSTMSDDGAPLERAGTMQPWSSSSNRRRSFTAFVAPRRASRASALADDDAEALSASDDAYSDGSPGA